MKGRYFVPISQHMVGATVVAFGGAVVVAFGGAAVVAFGGAAVVAFGGAAVVAFVAFVALYACTCTHVQLVTQPFWSFCVSHQGAIQ